MVIAYDFLLVLLSIAVAMLGAYTALIVLDKAKSTEHLSFKARVAVGGLTLGVGTWSMHFIGMLAIQLPIQANYAFLPTLISSFLAIILTGLALYAATSGVVRRYSRMVGGLLMGLGISSMHYVGMEALQIVCQVSYSTAGIVAATTFSVMISWLALWVMTSGVVLGRNHIVAAIFLGLAISTMHYVAMFGTQFDYLESAVLVDAPALNNTSLAAIVALVTFLLFDAFLLLALPGARDSKFRRKRRFGLGLATSLTQSWTTRVKSDHVHFEYGNDRATFGDGAETLGAPVAANEGQPPAPAPANGANGHGHGVAISSGGETRFINASKILFVTADGHYTRIGYENDHGDCCEQFCDSRLSAMAKRLEGEGFLRVHRSHLVNMARVVGYKRKGDSGEIIFESETAPRIPISRSQYAHVRETVERRLGDG